MRDGHRKSLKHMQSELHIFCHRRSQYRGPDGTRRKERKGSVFIIIAPMFGEHFLWAFSDITSFIQELWSSVLSPGARAPRLAAKLARVGPRWRFMIHPRPSTTGDSRTGEECKLESPALKQQK